jgi:hypothetical protein
MWLPEILHASHCWKCWVSQFITHYSIGWLVTGFTLSLADLLVGFWARYLVTFVN